MFSTHNRCQVSTDIQDRDFLAKEKHLKNLQDKLQVGEEIISKIECISEEAIGISTVQASFHRHLFEELLIQSSQKVREIESQMSKHELAARVLDPIDYCIISEQDKIWDVFIKIPTGPT